MAKSWTNPCTIGYEIKVRRDDFLKDEKWLNYIDFCNQFYFVCPPKVILPNEIPEQAGLYVSTVNAKRLYLKKKAPFREIQIPDTIFKYILMSRVKLDLEYCRDQNQYWQNWLKTKDEKKELGWNVSCKIRQEMERRCFKVETENHRLEIENKKLAEAKAMLNKLGVNIFSWNLERDIGQKLTELKTGLPIELKPNLEAASQHIMKALNIIHKKTNTNEYE
jgi:hypothetical protein